MEQGEKQETELVARLERLQQENKHRSERVKELRREETQLCTDETRNRQHETDLRAHLEKIHEQVRIYAHKKMPNELFFVWFFCVFFCCYC